MSLTPYKIACLVAAGAILSGCPSIEDSYAPPQQRKPLGSDPPKVRKSVLAMNDPAAPLQFLRDIQLDLHQQTWRWTGKNPKLALGLVKDPVKLVVDLATTDETLKDTGPVEIRFVLNGQELGRQQYSEPGKFQFTAPVPPGLARTKVDNELAMEIDKTWTSEKHPGPHGFILVRAGLLENDLVRPE